MKKTVNIKPPEATGKTVYKTKNRQVIDLLSQRGGATLDEMSTLAGWLPHSTRSFLTGLKKKDHIIESEKVDGVRRYRIVANGAA